MSGWRATFPTERLFGDPRFLRLLEADQSLLLRLYARCDRWGRGPADASVLPLHLMVMRQDVREQLDRTSRSGLVQVYRVGDAWYYAIAGYDDDCLRDTIRKRGVSNYPGPEEAVETVAALPQGQTDSAPTLPQGQTDPAPTLPEVETLSTAQNKGQADSAPRADQGQTSSVHARQQSRAEQSRAEQSSSTAARARVQEPDPPPDPRVTSAVERWLAAHARMVPTAMLEAGSVLTVARDFTADDFEAGVEHHIGETDLGVWQRVPLKYLRKRCEWARDRPKPTAKRAQGPPSSLPPGVKPYTADYDGPRVIGVLR